MYGCAHVTRTRAIGPRRRSSCSSTSCSSSLSHRPRPANTRNVGRPHASGEAAGRTTWHPGHIAEQYGLFTIIVLGESLLSATIGVQAALDDESTLGDLVVVIVGGLLIVFSMWWIYFDMPANRMVQGARAAFTDHLAGAFLWGYGHYLVFASVAATGAGLPSPSIA
jgi:hypothetical protein